MKCHKTFVKIKTTPAQEIFNKADKNGDGHITGHDWIELAKEYDPKHKGIPGIDEVVFLLVFS